MSAALQMRPPATMAEFLAWEKHQPLRYEWDGVQPFAMVGGSFAHTELASRMYDILRPALRGRCTVVRADLKVFTTNRSRIRYPDLVVSCSPLRAADDEIPEPALIVEVLSDSTTAVDRGVKRAEYAALPSLQRYVMLAQEAPIALVCARGDGFEERVAQDVLRLPELGLSVPVPPLYEGLLLGAGE
ncbi:MAG TPA: Uma2 family endonuclease [Acetobacteraceae bacterium]|nr:Uma2 family endonuclease [Acetobacteraceae bacterium]